MKLYFVLSGCLASLVVAAAHQFDHQPVLWPRTSETVSTFRNSDKHTILLRRAKDSPLVIRNFDDLHEPVLYARSPAGSKTGREGSRAGSLAASRTGSDASGVQTPREKSPSPRPHKQVNFNTPSPSPGPGRSMSPSIESSGTPFRGFTPDSIRSHSRPPSGSPSPGPYDGSNVRGSNRRGGPGRSSGTTRGGSSAGSDHGTTRGGYRGRGSPMSTTGRGGRSRGSSATASQASPSRPRSAVLYGSRGQEYINPFAVPVALPHQHAEHQGGFNQHVYHGPQSPYHAQQIPAYHPRPSSSIRMPPGEWSPASVSVHSGGTEGYLETRHGLSAGHMRDSTRVAAIMPSAPNDPSTVMAQNPEAVHGVTHATALHADSVSGARATGSRAVGTRITHAPGSKAAIISTAGGQRTESIKTSGNGAGSVAVWSTNSAWDANPIQHTALLRGSGRIQTSAFNVQPPEFFQNNQGQGM